MVSTIGVGLILQEVATKAFGGEQVGFPHRLEPVTWRLGPITISSVQLLILGVSLALMVALHLWVTRPRMGMAMRASAESTLTARLLGISTDRVILVTFAVASALAGAAGVLVGLSFNAISPFMGSDMGVKGLAIMLLGGLGNIYGAMVGGLLLGAIEVLSVAYLASSYRDAFVFAVMILILIFRPQGLFGVGQVR